MRGLEGREIEGRELEGRELERMAVGALDWWRRFKPVLMDLIAANPAIKD